MNDLENRVQNTELAIIALWVNIKDTVPIEVKNNIDLMVEDYAKSQLSLGATITTDFIKKEKMNIKEYQKFTETTALYPEEYEDSYLSTGLAAEVGEVCTVYAKYFRNDFGKDVLKRRVENELGDILWFVSQICNSLDFDLQEIMGNNVEKLSKRKEDGTIQGDGEDR